MENRFIIVTSYFAVQIQVVNLIKKMSAVFRYLAEISCTISEIILVCLECSTPL